jgi:putative (di)nucleoside polyphosphate hydrolase
MIAGQDNEQPATESSYRPCAGIMLLNSARQVWVGRRLDMTSHAWQMPQGGIDAGETAEAAARRELEEETGIVPARTEIIAASRDWHQYDLPPEMLNGAWGGRYKGQRQKWYVMRFLGDDSHININTHEPEFAEWRWSEANELPHNIVPFKRPLYEALLVEFAAFL